MIRTLSALILFATLSACGADGSMFCDAKVECPTGETCDLPNNRCVPAAMVSPNNLPAGQCRTNGECVGQMYCDLPTGHSVGTCKSSGGTTPGDMGTPASKKPNGSTCGSDADCDSGYCTPASPRTCQNRPVPSGPGDEYQVEFSYPAPSGFYAQSSQPNIGGDVIYGTNFYQLPSTGATVTQTVRKMANGKSAACICVSLTRYYCADPRTSTTGCLAGWIGTDYGSPNGTLIYKGTRTTIPSGNIQYGIGRGHCLMIGAMGIVPNTEGDC